MRFDSNVYYHELEPYPVDVMMDEWRQTARLYDETDFTTIWLGEHHFWYSGYPVAAPNPVLVGTHLATYTENLRVGQTACILPDWHPIRLAEDLAMLDQITRGRLDVGIARGTNSSTSIQFNRRRRPEEPGTELRPVQRGPWISYVRRGPRTLSPMMESFTSCRCPAGRKTIRGFTSATPATTGPMASL